MSSSTDKYAGFSAQEKRVMLERLLRKRAGADPSVHALSFGQQALWFLHRLAPDSAAYNVLYAARIRHELDTSALQRALQALIARHPILRTIYQTVDGEPVQQIRTDIEVRLESRDASSWAEESIRQRLILDAERPFTLEEGPILRATLFTISPVDHVLTLVVHHIAADFWSLVILTEDLSALYHAEISGQQYRMARPAALYADFVAWQHDMVSSSVGQRLREHWQGEMAGELPVIDLPADRPRPPVRTHNGALHDFVIDKQLIERLQLLGRSTETTLYMILLAVFHVLLHRYTGQAEIITASPAVNRKSIEFESVVGYFANPVALLARLSNNPTFLEVLAQIKERVLAALEHQYYPFPLLVKDLMVERDPSRSPICDVLFSWDKSHRIDDRNNTIIPGDGQDTRRGEKLTLEPMILTQLGAAYDVALMMFEGRESIAGSLQYNTDLFDEATMIRFASHYQNLLEAVVSSPRQRISDLQLMGAVERRQLLIEWNATTAEFPEETCIHQLFEAQAENRPRETAVIFDDERLAYGELNRRANQLGRYLQAFGVGPEKLVGICLERSVDMVVAVLGVLKAGAAYVPLDPEYPRERLAFLIDNTRVPVLLTQETILRNLPENDARIVCLDSDWTAISKHSEDNIDSGVRPENLAYVIHTSGSTGKPKGVLVQHRGLINLSEAQIRAFNLCAENRDLQFSSLSFDASIFEIVMALRVGATLCLVPRDVTFSTEALTQLLRDNAVTNVTLPPSVLAMFPQAEIPSLKTIIVAGEACTAELVSRWSGGRRFFNAYGPTETTVWASVVECKNDGTPPTIGKPIENTRLYVLDRHLQPAPIGVPGELHIGGVGLARGYLHLTDLTAEKFVPDPWSKQPGARMYRTGDKARFLTSGEVEFLGRFDHQVKIRGHRLEIGEIEAALSDHVLVRETLIVARKDVRGGQQLVAYVVPAQGQKPATTELRRHLKSRLPDYMIPAAFILLESLPLSPNGKIDRRALPAPELYRPDCNSTYVAPESEIEQEIASIWREVLGIERVGAHDNFFDLGGHSLRMGQVHARLQGVDDRKLSLVEMFQYPTVSSLAQFLSSNRSEQVTVEQSRRRADTRTKLIGERRGIRQQRRVLQET